MIDVDLILNTSLRQIKEIENSSQNLSVPRTSVEIPPALNEFARIIKRVS
jgi:hypothetical protein